MPRRWLGSPADNSHGKHERDVTETQRNRATSSAGEIWLTAGLVVALLVLGAFLFRAAGMLDPDLLDVGGVLAPTDVPRFSLIEVHFTSPTYPDNPASHEGGLDAILAADILQANGSIAVAAYEFDLETVADALLGAWERGVEVRFVTDSDNVDERMVQRLDRAGIPVVEDGRGGIMHDKFVVIDEAIVWTGSWNLTENGTYRNNNNAVRIVSSRLAENYLAEFDEMFDERAFGPGSPANTPHAELVLNDPATGERVRLESYFAPEDGAVDRILTLVEAAGESVRFMAFSFTDDRLGQAVLRQAKAGRLVQGVFELRGSDTEYSEYKMLRRERPPLDVLTDGNPYSMHHKVFILDDETVILGSYNFTQSAAESNDENLLVIFDRKIAALYQEEFERVYLLAAAANR